MTVLRPGDRVVLKSGGPVMTLDTINTDIFDDNKITGVLCAWFVGNRLERARFDYNALVAAPPAEARAEAAEPQPAEAIADYKAVLDEMVAAMNDAGEAPGEASRTPGGRPGRGSAATDPGETAAPAARRVN